MTQLQTTLRDVVGLEPRTFYNGAGFVKAFLATLPPPRAGRGVKGDPALCAGSFIEDP